jgi:hypothetical protein
LSIDHTHFGLLGITNEAAREHLVAISRGVEEVDGLASRDAVPSRPDVERNVIARDDISGLADLVPGYRQSGNTR